jgi:hypothetical protein
MGNNQRLPQPGVLALQFAGEISGYNYFVVSENRFFAVLSIELVAATPSAT